MSTPGRLSTCARCGGTIEWYVSDLLRHGHWRHVTPPATGVALHTPEPDDGAVSGPDRDDLPECNACHHPQHDDAGEELCETRIGTGLYGSDGIEVTRWCPCTGSIPAGPSTVAPDPWTDPDAAAAAEPPPF